MSVEAVESSAFKVGDKVVLGFSVLYVTKLFGKSATLAYGKPGSKAAEFIAEKRVAQDRLLLATDARVVIADEAEVEYKRFEALRREHEKNLRELSKRMEAGF